ncbi:MAG TPA: PVC-type heme-binding CxxCH protein [Chthoniobacteraceae bacterium]|jgi:putative membrane-bound dehydrogenase-like protein|nr:PVC-type heme-binding CxxCH protein [Chthoniobacteraceae bacterium]
MFTLPPPSRLFISGAAMLALLASAPAETPSAQSLFDGKTLTDWSGNLEYWRVQDGTITGQIPEGQSLKRNEWIWWKGAVGDFDLSVEFRITGGPSANSGIQYRTRRKPDGEAAGYQADLDDGKVWLGRIYEESGRALIAERGTRVSIAPDGRRWSEAFAEPASLASVIHKDDWNTYRVVARASHVETWINGVLFSQLDDHQADKAAFTGQLAFQLHAGPGPAKIEFRNVLLTPFGETKKPVYPDVKPVTQAAPNPEMPTGIKPLGDDGKPRNLDFETGTLAGWKAEGDAWEGQPVEGDLTNARGKGHSEHQGKYWIGGYEKFGDTRKGRLTSASFKVTHPWASFLIGGGSDVKVERVEIVDEATGQVLQTASGQEREPMRRVAVDLQAHQGKRIFVRLVDEGVSGWGHLNFDDFVFHDQAPPAQIAKAPAPSQPGADRQGRLNESPVLWHLQPNPAKPTAIANPDAQSVVATMKLTPGFQAELIAAEPDVKQPIAFCMDERGRLWIAEGYSYPNKQPEGQGKDRIIILEDKDGDGIFETHKVFAEGLNLMSGLEIGFGGVFVGAAPELLFIPRDKEDHAGKPEVLLDGWGFQDTHETMNSFTWGPDGWLYGNQGVFTRSNIGAPGAPDAERLELHSGVWRYHPVTHKFEIFAHGGSNQWGLDFNSAGHLFMTHCRSFYGGGGTTHVIRNGHFWNQANNNYAPFISSVGPDFAPALKNFLPAAAQYDSGAGGAGKPGTDAVYGGHSHVGTMIYLGDNWPAIYRDRLFTNNLFGHQMNQQENIREGSGYHTFHAGYDLLSAPDPRYMAVDLQTGPDGAVYMVDWCDLQHCHNPAPDKWDRTNGRVYRVSWAETYKPVKVDLGTMSDLELAKLHTHLNDWYPRQARGLLQARAAKGKIDGLAIEELRKMLNAPGAMETQLRALLTLHVIGALDSAQLAQVAKSDSDILRGWAVQLATENAGRPLLAGATLAAMAKSDPSASVRLALASALPMLSPEDAWDIGVALAAHAEDKDDRFLPKMIWYGVAPVIAGKPELGMRLAQTTPMPTLVDDVLWYLGSTEAGRNALFFSLPQEPEKAARPLKLLAFALKNEASAAPPKTWRLIQQRFENAADPTVGAAVDELSAVFGDKLVLEKVRARLGDKALPMPARQQAFALLKRVGDQQSLPLFAELLDQPEFRKDVIPLLGRSNNPAVAINLIQRFPKFDATDRVAALTSLTSRPELALPLLEALKAGKFERKDLTALQVRQLRNLRNDEVNKLLDETWGKVNESSEAAKATIARLKKLYSTAPLWASDAKAGKVTFTQMCGTCHALNGVGGKLGPDLAGSWRNGLDYFLENIVDPNAVVGENFQLHVITKKDGSVVSGLLEKETPTTITLRTVTEPVNIATGDVKMHEKLAQSLMPPGLLEALPEPKVLELLKFLLSKQD